MIDIEACRECYLYKHSNVYENFFARPCRQPHPIVWAKLRGSPFWPAKCLKIHNGHADVRFFGTHEKANISLNQVYKYSREHPDNKRSSQQKYRKALSETQIYIANYVNKFNGFEYAKKRTPLDDIHRKKQHRRGRGSGGDETLREHRPGFSEVGESNTVARECFVLLDVNDTAGQDLNCDSASNKKKSQTQENKTQSHEDPVETEVRAVLQQTSESAANLHGKEKENVFNLRTGESLSDNMTFTAEKNGHNDANAGDDLITRHSLSANAPKMYKFAGPSCSRSQNSVKMNGQKFSNDPSSSSASLPVITSAIGDTDSRNFIPSSMKTSATCDTLANIPSQGSSKQSSSTRKFVPKTKNFIESRGDEEDFDDDDDGQMLPDVETSDSRWSQEIDAFVENDAISNPFFESLLTNTPQSRALLNQLQRFTKKIFLKIWLDGNGDNQNTDFKAFLPAYEKCLREIECLEAEHNKLRAENEQLLAEQEKLKERIPEPSKKDLHLRDLIVQATAANYCERELEYWAKKKKILSEELDDVRSENKYLVQCHTTEIDMKNEIIKELKEKIPSCHKECQVDLFKNADNTRECLDSQIMPDLKELSGSCSDSFEHQDFSHIELQNFNNFTHSNLQFQNHSETVNQINIEQDNLPGSSSQHLGFF